MKELSDYLQSKGIEHFIADDTVNLPKLGECFILDSDRKVITYDKVEDKVKLNLPNPDYYYLEDGINYCVFKFGDNFYYSPIDSSEGVKLNRLLHIGDYQMPSSMTYVPLGIRDKFDLLNGSGDAKDWVKAAKFFDLNCIGYSNENTLAGALHFQKACIAGDIKYVSGIQTKFRYLNFDIKCKIFCNDSDSWSQMLRLQKETSVDNWEDPHTSGNNVDKLYMVISKFEAKNLNDDIINQMKSFFKDVFFQVDLNEYMYYKTNKDVGENFMHYWNNYREKIKPICLPDIFYIDKDDYDIKEVLTNIAKKPRIYLSKDQYLKTGDEIYNDWKKYFKDEAEYNGFISEAMNNTLIIAPDNNIEMIQSSLYAPKYEQTPKEYSRFKGNNMLMLETLVMEGLKSYIPEKDWPKYINRLKSEMYVIRSTNNIDYYLITWDEVNAARGMGIYTGIGRGSAGGCLVSYFLGIVDADPLKYDLIFERFLTPERCGLLPNDVTCFLEPSEAECVKLNILGHDFNVTNDSELMVLRDNKKIKISISDLQGLDKVIVDRCDELWYIENYSKNPKVKLGIKSGYLLEGKPSMPDIDIDFESSGLEKVKDYLRNRYDDGDNKFVFSAGTFTTLKVKSAIKDVGRTYGLKHDLLNYITAIIKDDNCTFSEFIELCCKTPKLKDFINTYPEVIELSHKIMGQPKAKSIHASAFVIAPKIKESCFDFIPIRMQDGILVSEFDGVEIDSIGMLKNDILGLKQLDKLHDMIDKVNYYYPEDNVDLRDIYTNKLNDRGAMDMFCNGNTSDIFQFSSQGMTSFIKSMQPSDINDIIAANALYRPGAMSIGDHERYIEHKHGIATPTYNYGCYQWTKDTYGAFVFQEQYMLVAQHVAGFSLSKADVLRKAIGKKKADLMHSLMGDFVDGAVKNGCPDDEAKAIWDKIEMAGKYSFNKTHSCSYGLTAYCCAWLAKHYPMAYYSVILDYADDSKKKEIISEIGKIGSIKMLSPDINRSIDTFFSDYSNKTIHWSLSAIKYMPTEAVKLIIQDRSDYGNYTSIESFLDRMKDRVKLKKAELGKYNNPFNIRAIKNLIMAGAFDNIYNVLESRERMSIIELAYKYMGRDIASEFKDPIANHNYFWNKTQIEISGFGVVDFKNIYNVSEFKKLIRSTKYRSVSDCLSSKMEGSRAVICGVIENVIERTGKTKDGKPYMFGKIELIQNSDKITIVIWNDAWASFRGNFINSTGKVMGIAGKIKYDNFNKCNVMQVLKNSKVGILA